MAFRMDFSTRGLVPALGRLSATPALIERAKKSALASIGWSMQQALKQEGKKAAFGGSLGWAPRSEVTLDAAKNPPIPAPPKAPGRRRKRTNPLTYWARVGNAREALAPMSRLVAAMRYKVYADSGRVVVGYLPEGFWADRFAEMQAGYIKKPQAGKQSGVGNVDKMRKYFAAIKHPMRRGVTLRVPARNLVGPVLARYQDNFLAWFQQRFFERLDHYLAGDAK